MSIGYDVTYPRTRGGRGEKGEREGRGERVRGEGLTRVDLLVDGLLERSI